VLLGAAAVFGAALASALVMRALRASFAGAPRWPWLLAAPPAGALSAFASVAFVRLLVPAHVLAAGQPAPAMMLAALVLAPLGEEWLCRGAAWHACRHLAPARTTLLVTAVLFAFLRGLGGGFLLELPHRFVAGLLFGWLRWKSGSLVPPILAHAAHNTLAVTVLA
jgi:membrane protease YdiL (CAAX protease family)